MISIILVIYTTMAIITVIASFMITLGFWHTLGKYSKSQRGLLEDKEIRKKIAKRDNYVCQICGKYIPSEEELRIDYIIPLSRGGKAIDSNLRIVCFKCRDENREV